MVQRSDSVSKVKLFLSYGRMDAGDLAHRLKTDLEKQGYEVWQDAHRIHAGQKWEERIKEALKSTHLVVALLSPHAVRQSGDPENPDGLDSVCLDEISFARFSLSPKPIVPVMAIPCEPPFSIFRLDYVDMCAWKDSEEQYQTGFKRLLEAIKTALNGRVQFRKWEAKLTPWDFSAYMYEKRRNFCGRKWMFDEIEAWCSSNRGPALLIVGDPGIGKSAFVAQLVHLNPNNQILAYHCCQAATKATLEPTLFIRSLAAMIASKLYEYADMLSYPDMDEVLSKEFCSKDPGSAFERGILSPLKHIHPPCLRSRYIIIDALDEALSLPANKMTILDLLASRLEQLPHWLRIVATTRKDPTVLDRLSGLKTNLFDAHDAKNLEDIDRYIKLRLESSNLRKQLTISKQPSKSIEKILRAKSEGNFLYIQQVFESIERDVYSFENLDSLPPGLSGLYLSFFRRKFPDKSDYAPIRRILEILLASQEPLTEEIIKRAADLDTEYEFYHSLRMLAAYITERKMGDGEKRYAFYHKSLPDWLTDSDKRGTLYYINLKSGHERLTKLCWEDYKAGVQNISPYCMEHMSTHLMETKRWQELLEVVSDPKLALIKKWIEEGKGAKGLSCLVGLIRFIEEQDQSSVKSAALATQAARIYGLWGKYDSARKWLEYAANNTSWWRGRRVKAIALHELASLFLYRRKLYDAKRLYLRALRFCLWGNPVYHDEASANLIGLSTIAKEKYLFSEAIRLSNRALKEAKKMNDIRHIIAAKRLLGVVYTLLGEYKKSKLHLQEASYLCKKYNIGLEKARLMLSMGWLQYDQALLHRKQSLKSKEYFQKALSEAEYHGDRYCFKEARMSLAWYALSDNEVSEAMDWLKSIKNSIHTQTHPELYAGISLGLAAISHQEGNLKEAEHKYKGITLFCNKYDIRTWKYKALVGLGAAQWHLNKMEQAERTFKQALQTALQISPVKHSLSKINIDLCRNDIQKTPR